MAHNREWFKGAIRHELYGFLWLVRQEPPR